jgi:hypothetical protein
MYVADPIAEQTKWVQEDRDFKTSVDKLVALKVRVSLPEAFE